MRVLASHVPGAVLQAAHDADAARAKAADETGARSSPPMRSRWCAIRLSMLC
jgi:hypothetical protein